MSTRQEVEDALAGGQATAFAPKEDGKEIVTVFVRKDGDDRVLSFRKPIQAADEMDAQVLNRGFAFDGNSIVRRVTPRTMVQYYYREEPVKPADKGIAALMEGTEDRPLLEALREAEIMVRDWLAEAGLLVYFA